MGWVGSLKMDPRITLVYRVPFSSRLTFRSIKIVIYVKTTQGHWRCHHFDRRVRVPIVFPCNYMALSCIVSEIKGNSGEKSRFFMRPSTQQRRGGEAVANVFTLFPSQPSQIPGLPGKINYGKSSPFMNSTHVLQRERWTDRQTDGKVISIAERLLAR